MRHAPKMFGLASLAVLAALSLSPTAQAQSATSGSSGGDKTGAAPPPSAQTTNTAATARKAARPYFLEFRARNAAQYGHTFVQYGKVGTKGRIAGLHPAGDAPNCENCSAVPWMVGHLLPVPAETGASDGDDEPELYLLARYRIMLTPTEFKIVDAHIRQKQGDAKMWQALFNNCNQFAAEIAEFMGLEAPNTWLPSGEFVQALEKKNGGALLKTAKLPDGAVRDAPPLLSARATKTSEAQAR